VKIKESKMSLSQRVLGAVDLAIEFATLGEYGLEQIEQPELGVAAQRCRRERSGLRLGAPTVAQARRGACETPATATNCLADAHVARR
jgi:hypothetical protein